MRFRDIPQFPSACWSAHFSWDGIERALDRWINEQGEGIAKLNLDPDFQRAHVWTREQQIAYIEYVLQGGEVGRNIIFNCPGWMVDFRGPFELIDGKQRLEAARTFMMGNIPAFGYYRKDFTDKPSFSDVGFNFQVCKIPDREGILQLYLNINAGGTPHTEEELDKVRRMLKELK
jgi:hypothetical protein